MCLASYGPKEFGRFRSVARSGQESIAQGLPWVISPTRISPEGATRYGENRFRTLEPDRVRISSPFRAKRLFRLTQGKPWAKLSCPFGAGPSGRMTGAKHILYQVRQWQSGDSLHERLVVFLGDGLIGNPDDTVDHFRIGFLLDQQISGINCLITLANGILKHGVVQFTLVH
jgi:hypothetical protein